MLALHPLSPRITMETSLQLMSNAKVHNHMHHLLTPPLPPPPSLICHKDLELSGDYEEALHSYQRCAALGHAPACAAIAWLHIDQLVGGSSGDQAYS